MKKMRHTGIPVLAAVLLLSGLTGFSAAQTAQHSQPSPEHFPASSRCMASCDEMEIRCDELEKEFPACGTGDICLDEKDQCQAKCRITAMTYPAASGSKG